MAKESKKEKEVPEMTAAEARKYRQDKYKAKAPEMSDEQKREAFRLHWAQEKSKYGKSKDLEEILWLHLKAIKMDTPEKFEAGIKHFGLSKLGN
jgi:hypothetical protein